MSTTKTSDAVEAAADLTTATPTELAVIIRKDWKQPFYGAVPYISAMRSLPDFESNYGLDSGRDIALRFLCNAGTWRGATARAVKAELKRRLGVK